LVRPEPRKFQIGEKKSEVVTGKGSHQQGRRKEAVSANRTRFFHRRRKIGIQKGGREMSGERISARTKTFSPIWEDTLSQLAGGKGTQMREKLK